MSFKVQLRLPDGRAYRGALRAHPSGDAGTLWYEGFVTALDPAVYARDEELNADGAMPALAPQRLGLWPCQLKLNPTPSRERDDINGEYVGRLWVSAADGCPGGEIYTIVANSSAEPGFTGHVTSYVKT